jgi:glycine/D-amino acid oxidase-like deaminating enzyme
VAKIRVLPADDTTNGWSRIMPPREPKPALAGDQRADWLVVGAGYAGLAAARRLAENRPGDEIVLLEAQQVGEGASGRNSGFAIDLPHNVSNTLEELQASRRFMDLGRAAIDYLKDGVKAGGFDCDWARRGKYHSAVSPRGTKTVLEPLVKELEALDEPYRWLDRDALAAEIGTAYHHAAVYTPGCVLMNPAALTRGLADSLPENVTLHENSPVIETDYRNGVRLATPHGSIYAPKMILAANGFASQFGFFRGRLLILAAHASLSRRLTAEERQALGGNDDWGVTPVNAFAGVTLRFTRDRRILIRQRVTHGPSFRRSDADRRAVRQHHEVALRRRFPMLPEVSLEHTWTGFVCLSRNHAPGFGRVAPNITAAVCQNAIGVTRGTISGLLAADLANGRDNPMIADLEDLGKPDKLPPRPFLDIGVEARFAWELWSNRAER